MSKLDRDIADAMTTADLWKMMRRRVPPIVSEYFRGGADSETTLRGNVRAFQQSVTTAYGALKFDSIDTTTSVVGHDLAIPWFITPVGSLRNLYPMGYAVASQVAGEFGTVMAQSTLSGTPLEDVAAASKGSCPCAGRCTLRLKKVHGRSGTTRLRSRATSKSDAVAISIPASRFGAAPTPVDGGPGVSAMALSIVPRVT